MMVGGVGLSWVLLHLYLFFNASIVCRQKPECEMSCIEAKSKTRSIRKKMKISEFIRSSLYQILFLVFFLTRQSQVSRSFVA